MGIFSKARDVRSTNIAEMLAKSDEPLRLVRVIISEMEDTLVEARSTAVRTLARRKELERLRTELHGQAQDWEEKAELAVRKKREDLARGALAMKARALAELQEVEKALPAVQEQVQKLDADIAELHAKLSDARARQRLLTIRGESSVARRRVRAQLSEPNLERHEDAFTDSERAVDRLESEAETFRLGEKALAAELARLETDARIEADLARLRERLSKADDPDPSQN